MKMLLQEQQQQQEQQQRRHRRCRCCCCAATLALAAPVNWWGQHSSNNNSGARDGYFSWIHTHTYTHGRVQLFSLCKKWRYRYKCIYIQLYVRKYTHIHTGTYTRTHRYILLLAMRLQQMHIQYSHWQLGAQYTRNGSTTQASIKLNNKLNNLILIIFKNTHTKNVVSSLALQIFTNTNNGKHTRP